MRLLYNKKKYSDKKALIPTELTTRNFLLFLNFSLHFIISFQLENLEDYPLFTYGFSQPANASQIVTDGASNTMNRFYRNFDYGNNEGYGNSGSYGHNAACGSDAAGGTSCVGHGSLISEPPSNSSGFYPGANSYYISQPGQSSFSINSQPLAEIAPQVRTKLPQQ